STMRSRDPPGRSHKRDTYPSRIFPKKTSGRGYEHFPRDRQRRKPLSHQGWRSKKQAETGVRGIKCASADQPGWECRMSWFRAFPRIEQLVKDHYEELYRFAYRLSGAAAEAEDLVQETFCQA